MTHGGRLIRNKILAADELSTSFSRRHPGVFLSANCLYLLLFTATNGFNLATPSEKPAKCRTGTIWSV